MRSVICCGTLLLVLVLATHCGFRFDNPVEQCPTTGCVQGAGQDADYSQSWRPDADFVLGPRPDGGLVEAPDAAFLLPTWSSSNACVTGNESPNFTGVWEGYFQGSQIGDEYSTFRLTIVGANATLGLCGTMAFGTHTAAVTLPPVADPTDWYPPASYYPPGQTNRQPAPQILGLPYTILDGKTDGQRATFAVGLNETYVAWCGLQTSYPWPHDNSQGFLFGCFPQWQTMSTTPLGPGDCVAKNPTTGLSEVVSCAQVMFCDAVCACDASRCTALQFYRNVYGEMVYPRYWRFDLSFSGDNVTGMASQDQGTQNVLMHRVSH